MLRLCVICNEEKELEFFCKRKGNARKRLCKKCHANKEKDRRSKWSPEKKKEKVKQCYDLFKKRKLRLLEKPDSLEEKIKFWMANALRRGGRKKENEQFSSRKNLSKEVLFRKSLEAFEKFPYINFLFIDNTGQNRAFAASIDRINPQLPYSDDNIQVLPLWLNSAKLDLQQDEFDEILINHILSDEHLCARLLSRKSGGDAL